MRSGAGQRERQDAEDARATGCSGMDMMVIYLTVEIKRDLSCSD